MVLPVWAGPPATLYIIMRPPWWLLCFVNVSVCITNIQTSFHGEAMPFEMAFERWQKDFEALCL